MSQDLRPHGQPVKVGPRNPIIAILAAHHIPESKIRAFEYKADNLINELEVSKAGRYKNYAVFLVGVLPEDNGNIVPRISIEIDQSITLYCWQIRILYRDPNHSPNPDPWSYELPYFDSPFFIEAIWHEPIRDYKL